MQGQIMSNPQTHEGQQPMNRRAFLYTATVVTVTAATAVFGTRTAAAQSALPPSDMQLDLKRTARVVTDPQIHFLSPKGVTWGVVGKNVQELHTVENIGRLFATAKQAGMTVAVSPHYYYPTDKGWQFEGALEKLMHKIGMFDRPSAYSLEGFENSGADFLPQYKKYIHDGKTIIVSPHKVYGPEQNDLVLQLRKQRVDQIILAGMSVNLCVEAHLRELLEQGFEVPWCRMRPPRPSSRLVTATSPPSSTSASLPMQCGVPTKRSSGCVARPAKGEEQHAL